jgi:hypothetical protein
VTADICMSGVGCLDKMEERKLGRRAHSLIKGQNRLDYLIDWICCGRSAQ